MKQITQFFLEGESQTLKYSLADLITQHLQENNSLFNDL